MTLTPETLKLIREALKAFACPCADKCEDGCRDINKCWGRRAAAVLAALLAALNEEIPNGYTEGSEAPPMKKGEGE